MLLLFWFQNFKNRLLMLLLVSANLIMLSYGIYHFAAHYYATVQSASSLAQIEQKVSSTAHLQEQYKKIITKEPDTVRALVRLAITYAANKDYENACALYKSALVLEPRLIKVYTALGQSLQALGDVDQALDYYTKALQLDPHDFDLHISVSKAYMRQGAYENALKHALKAQQLDPRNIHSYLNCGHIYNKQGNLNAAVGQYQKALKVDPNFANAHYNLGYTLRIQNKTEQAIYHLQQAQRLQKKYVDAHIALAQAYWQQKELLLAWPEYEWRWKLLKIDPNHMDVPLWNGCDLTGKTILLYAEQGLGDTLQFIRYAKLVKEKGAQKIICKVQKPLLTLLADYPYVDSLTTKIENTHIDYQAPLLSLPGIFKTTHETIPACKSYLHANKKLAADWKNKLSSDENFKVGLCWHVDPQHEVDKSPWSKRSIPLLAFQSLGHIKGVSFYSLQKTNGEDQLKDLPESFPLHTFGPHFDQTHGRFADTAAVIENLDLIISVDTSVAHVAGALGKPVWMLLPISPDPRWYETDGTTPWYPTMRLFRQTQPQDWQKPLANIKEELARAVAK